MCIKNLILALAAGTLCMLRGVHSTYLWWSCPSVQLESSFDLTLYSGMWYEHYRDRAILFEDGDCVQAKYTQSSGNTIEVRNSQRTPGKSAIDYKIFGKAYYKNK